MKNTIIRALTGCAGVLWLAVGLAGCTNGGPDIDCSYGSCLCDTGEIIDEAWICDGDNDCGDWQDEDGCKPPDSGSDDDDDDDTYDDDEGLQACWDCTQLPCRLYYDYYCFY